MVSVQRTHQHTRMAYGNRSPLYTHSRTHARVACMSIRLIVIVYTQVYNVWPMFIIQWLSHTYIQHTSTHTKQTSGWIAGESSLNVFVMLAWRATLNRCWMRVKLPGQDMMNRTAANCRILTKRRRRQRRMEQLILLGCECWCSHTGAHTLFSRRREKFWISILCLHIPSGWDWMGCHNHQFA